MNNLPDYHTKYLNQDVLKFTNALCDRNVIGAKRVIRKLTLGRLLLVQYLELSACHVLSHLPQNRTVCSPKTGDLILYLALPFFDNNLPNLRRRQNFVDVGEEM